MSTDQTLAVCSSCGTQYDEVAPATCAISHDPRSSLRGKPLSWTTLAELRTRHRNVFGEEVGLVGFTTEPSFAFRQRGFLVPWRGSNLMWDCMALLDDETVARIEEQGGLAGIAISHPHFYTTMVEWAQRFDCPVYLHEDDRGWVVRHDERLRFWSGETHDLGEGLTLIRTGGHFAGSQVLHIASKATVLVSDAVVLTTDPDHVSFEYSWAQFLPLDEQAVRGIADAFEPFEFETLVGGWWGHVVPKGGKEMIRRSAERYISAVRGELSARTLPAPGEERR